MKYTNLCFLLIFSLFSCNTKRSYNKSDLYIENYRFDSDTLRIDYNALLESYYYPCGCDTTSTNDTLYLDFKKEVFDKVNKCDVKAEYDPVLKVRHLKIRVNNKQVVISSLGLLHR